MTGYDEFRPLPGDEVIPDARVELNRVTTYPVAAAQLWPWLVQLGKGRAGWYLPRHVERLVPPSRRALWYVDERYQHLQPGDVVDDWGHGQPTFTVVSVAPPQALVYRTSRPRRRRSRPDLEASWALVCQDRSSGGCRLHLRLRADQFGNRAPRLATAAADVVDRVTVDLLFAGLADRLDGSLSSD